MTTERRHEAKKAQRIFAGGLGHPPTSGIKTPLCLACYVMEIHKKPNLGNGIAVVFCDTHKI